MSAVRRWLVEVLDRRDRYADEGALRALLRRALGYGSPSRRLRRALDRP